MTASVVVRARILIASAGVVALAAGAVAVRAATEPGPPVRSRRLVATTMSIPGPRPALPWPRRGEAALATAKGTAIGTSGPRVPVPIASVTKVMTAYLVLRDHPLAEGAAGFRMTITPEEAAELPWRIRQGQSLLGLRAGQTLTEREALDALLVLSADNVADVLARADAGSDAVFVRRMNAAARRLGMTRTRFAGPSGFDPRSVSDATDLMLLGRAAMAIPAFASIVAQPSATIPGLVAFRNYNRLVGRDGFTGIKTGSTDAAGQALLFSVTRVIAGRPVSILGAVLGQRGPGVVTGALRAARRLADGYYRTLAPRVVLPAGTPVAALTRLGRSVRLATTAPLTVVAPPGAVVRLRVVLDLGDPSRPAARVVASSPASGGRADVAARGPALPSPSIGWRLRHLL